MAAHVFVDTSAFYVLGSEADEHHRIAADVLAGLARERAVLCTSNFVLAETYGLMIRRCGRASAQAFLERVRDGLVQVHQATVEDQKRAEAILEQYDDQDFSYVDAVSFAVIERRKIRHAFALDSHFAVFKPRSGSLTVHP